MKIVIDLNIRTFRIMVMFLGLRERERARVHVKILNDVPIIASVNSMSVHHREQRLGRTSEILLHPTLL